MKYFCFLYHFFSDVCGALLAELVKASDCPKDYQCSKCGGKKISMVEVCNDGKCRPKFHAGCFVTKNRGKKWTVDDATDCANFYDLYSGCKGFSFGKKLLFLNYIGCRLVTDMKNFRNKPYYTQEPKDTSQGIIRHFMQEPKAQFKRYG